MPGARKKRKGQTKVNPSAQIRTPKGGDVWAGGVSRYSGAENAGEGGSNLDARGEGGKKGRIVHWGKA